MSEIKGGFWDWQSSHLSDDVVEVHSFDEFSYEVNSILVLASFDQFCDERVVDLEQNFLFLLHFSHHIEVSDGGDFDRFYGIKDGFFWMFRENDSAEVSLSERLDRHERIDFKTLVLHLDALFQIRSHANVQNFYELSFGQNPTGDSLCSSLDGGGPLFGAEDAPFAKVVVHCDRPYFKVVFDDVNEPFLYYKEVVRFFVLLNDYFVFRELFHFQTRSDAVQRVVRQIVQNLYFLEHFEELVVPNHLLHSHSKKLFNSLL